jgi:hypothetical protein
MYPTHDSSQPWPFRVNSDICNAGYELPDIELSDNLESRYSLYQAYIQSLPSKVIIPTSVPIKQISLIFGSDSELVVSKILNALSDKITSSIKISRIAGEIYDGLSMGVRGPKNRVAYLDKMIGLEQASLDISDILKANGCYIQDRWMPYLYETILPDYSLLLILPRDVEEFSDTMCSRDYW